MLEAHPACSRRPCIGAPGRASGARRSSAIVVRAAGRRGRRATSCARTARARARRRTRCPRRSSSRDAAAAHARRASCCAGSCAMSFDADAHRDASLRGLGSGRRRAGAPPATRCASSARSGLALDGRRGRAAAGRARARAGGRAWARPACSPPSWSRRAAASIISDQAEAMLDGARERAAELGLEQRRVPVAERRMDRPARWRASTSSLCRWGYMLMADPAAALRETRRVLRPGGRARARRLGRGRGATRGRCCPAPELARARPRRPSRRRRARRDRSRSATPSAIARAARARRASPRSRSRRSSCVRRHASFEEFWETTLDLSRAFHDAVLAAPERGDRARSSAALARALRAVRGRRRRARRSRPHARRAAPSA